MMNLSDSAQRNRSAIIAQAQRLAETRHTRKILAFLAVHPMIAAVLKISPWIGTAHALATFWLGVLWIRKGRTPSRVIPVLGYIAASEIVWRGTGARIFWEFGKYSIAALCVFAIVRFKLWTRINKVALLYFAVLVPSIFVMPSFDREQIAFNLSGPFALAIATAFLSTQSLDRETFKRLLIAMVAPTIGMAALATFSTVTTPDINFMGSKVTSAGIGPNQVSAILGLGAMMAFFFAIIDRRNNTLRWVLFSCGLWFSAQSALTFSRGGLMTMVGAGAAGSFFLMRDRRSRGALVVRGLLATLTAVFILVPALNLFTGGALGERFSSTSLTGRDKIIEGDLLAFSENPVLGVGPGQSKSYHAIVFRWSSAHTEYSRVLAEHGTFGAFALLLLIILSVQRLRRPAPLVSKAWAASTTVWALLYMFHSAMRLAAPALTFALGTSILLLDAAKSQPAPGPLRQRRRGLASPLGPRLQPGPAGATSVSESVGPAPPPLGAWTRQQESET